MRFEVKINRDRGYEVWEGNVLHRVFFDVVGCAVWLQKVAPAEGRDHRDQLHQVKELVQEFAELEKDIDKLVDDCSKI